jgi:hypothetical protein
MKRMHIAICAAAALLAGCGGGAGGMDAAPSAPLAQVPPEASASTAAMVGFLVELQRASARSESAEPLALGAYDPPRPDNTEPEPVS